MKTALICHEADEINRDGLARWLASFSELVGVVVLRETSKRKRRRVQHEVRRVGWLRMADVAAFRDLQAGAESSFFVRSGNQVVQQDAENSGHRHAR